VRGGSSGWRAGWFAKDMVSRVLEGVIRIVG